MTIQLIEMIKNAVFRKQETSHFIKMIFGFLRVMQRILGLKSMSGLTLHHSTLTTSLCGRQAMTLPSSLPVIGPVCTQMWSGQFASVTDTC